MCVCFGQMTQHNVGALVVVKPGEQQSLAGIITERGKKNLIVRESFCFVSFDMCDPFPSVSDIAISLDYLRKIIVQGRSSKSTKVGDIMTEEV